MKKTYHLTIEYDSETDTVEYIMESVEDGDEVTLVEIGGVDISKYFNKEILRLIAECYEIGEA